MNRYLVVEAFADRDSRAGDTVRMQVLNLHASVTAAYWHWQPKGLDRLRLIDLKTRQVYDWDAAFRLMAYENVTRLEQQRRVTPRVYAVLHACGYVSATGDITAKGHDLIAEFRPPPPLLVHLGHIRTRSRLHR